MSVAEKRVILNLLSMVVAAVVAWASASYFAQGQASKFDDLALGAETTSIFPSVDGQPIHGCYIDTVDPILQGWKERGKRPVALWLGNSQLHAINQASPDAVPASARIFRELQQFDVDFLTFSQPNASLQEHYVLFEYLADRFDVRWLVLPVVFDDLRETGIRDGLGPALQDVAVKARIEQTQAGREILAINGNSATVDGDESLAGVRNTLQEGSERTLNHWLQAHWSLWAARPELRGQVFATLYQQRNRLLGISSQSKRRMIPGRYAMNHAALAAILDSAASRGVRVLIYIPPLRSDVETPYEENEYSTFKQDLKGFASEKNAVFVNLETLVPGQFWGQMADIQGDGAGLDFMHFQEAGHELLAMALGGELANRLND